jgi:hypothetical protein
MLNSVLRYTVLKKENGAIECENIIHILCKFDMANYLSVFIKMNLVNYMCYPRAPLQLSRGPAAIELLKFFERKTADEQYVIFN